eukprot:TRINITY_DN4010_c0_g2_i1.p1 TRINITY_DN4010_c0_g2~~TRINITY_DN4010_c0_g2_i1.p1  ORF type:complete len:129 (+),score=34.43 TRINITY_DN4010_c0_g2_i1:116-502(+)
MKAPYSNAGTPRTPVTSWRQWLCLGGVCAVLLLYAPLLYFALSPGLLNRRGDGDATRLLQLEGKVSSLQADLVVAKEKGALVGDLQRDVLNLQQQLKSVTILNLNSTFNHYNVKLAANDKEHRVQLTS